MVTQIYYLLRSRQDGSYLAARPADEEGSGYLLVFNADYDALSYLNAHAPDLANNFSVESLPPSRLSPVLERWSYRGIGVVEEPRQPRVEFYLRS